MRIGVPREAKDHEFRVGLTPAGARLPAAAGHEVRVQAGAGDPGLAAGLNVADGKVVHAGLATDLGGMASA